MINFLSINKKRLNESDGDDLEWANDAIKNLPPIFNVTQTVDGKDYRIDERSKMGWIESLMEWNESELSKDGTKILQMGGSFSPSYALKFYLERGGYVLLGDGSVSYIVDDVVELSTTWDEHTGAWDMVKKFLLSLQVRMPINESEEDELDWAVEAINDDVYKWGSVKKILNDGDIISISGDICDGEGSCYLTLKDEPFIFSRNSRGVPYIRWSNDLDKRPSGWAGPSDTSKDAIQMDTATAQWDDELDVRILKREEYPF